MHRRIRKFLVAVIMVCLSAGVAYAGDWRFPVGIAYVSGFNDITDRYENNIEAEGYGVDSSEGIPIGLLFQPYYQFDSGLGIGIGLGPVMAVMGDRTFFDLPVAIDARYIILPNSEISPYLRAGVKKHFASGDYVESSTVGLFGGFGVELFRKKIVGMGLEVIYDSSSIEFETKSNSWGSTVIGKEDIKPSKLMVSLSAIF